VDCTFQRRRFIRTTLTIHTTAPAGGPVMRVIQLPWKSAALTMIDQVGRRATEMTGAAMIGSPARC